MSEVNFDEFGIVVNPEAIKEKFDQEKTEGSYQTWRISVGKKLPKLVARILPNPHRPEQYYTVYWHYGIKDFGLLCLKKNFDKECPICNMFESTKKDLIKSQADFQAQYPEKDAKAEFKEEWKALFAVEAKKRFYLPVIDRSDERPVVKYLDMSQTVKDFLVEKIIEKPMYLHPLQGRDWKLKYVPKPGTAWGDIVIDKDDDPSPVLPKGNVEEIKALLKSIPDLMTLLERPTFDELQTALFELANAKTEEPVTKQETPSVSEVKTEEQVKTQMDDFFNKKPGEVANG